MTRKIALGLIVVCTLAGSVTAPAGQPVTFQQRVEAQEAIERVYYAHRIWPAENPTPKPSFEQMVPRVVLSARVNDYLKKSASLAEFWQRPIEPEQLQAEMDRMAQRTKNPAMLKELFAALDNDPTLIAECLARPALADRLLSNCFTWDHRIHETAGGLAEQCLSALSPGSATLGRQPGFVRRIYVTEGTEPDSPDDETAAVSREELDRLLSSAPEAGRFSTVEETDGAFLIRHTLSRSQDRLELEVAAFQKQSLDPWLQEQPFDVSAVGAESGYYHLPIISPRTACTPGWYNQSLDDIPDPRYGHTAVWTGTEMIVWGGYSNAPLYYTGGRYNPATETWAPLAVEGCPSARMNHTAIWTGTVMVVWGGSSSIGVAALNTGGRYNPTSDTWQSTSVGTNCPSARTAHAAAWGAGAMVIWGGWDGTNYFNTGGRYDPVNDAWQSTATTGSCPLARRGPSGVWTGTEMIVWGGYDGASKVNTGGRYNPVTNVWSTVSTTSCPAARDGHTAIWTGTRMVIWGGYGAGYLNSGGRYVPSSDTWAPTSTGTNCPTARNLHTAVWADTPLLMIVWGGQTSSGPVNNGCTYEPVGDTWLTPTAATGAPLVRRNHTAVWSGTEMIIWGGEAGATPRPANTGGRYNPTGSGSWIDTNRTYAMPSPRVGHTGVWTGSEMIIWGGYDGGYINTGGQYTPATDAWTATGTGTNCPDARSGHSAVWSGNEMIVWGGADLVGKKTTGGRYYPSSRAWLTTSGVGPGIRAYQTAVWTGVYMIIRGGEFQHGT